ncbi:MAG: MraY family glycosyltransferase [Syntrophotaleaceae bacterium]
MSYFAALLMSLFITLALVPLLRTFAIRWGAVDLPNERKVHKRPIPRIGGVAMAFGVMIPVLLWMPNTSLLLPLVTASGLIAAFGFLDDLRELNSATKFGVQVLAALIVIFWGGVQIRSLDGLLPEGFLLPPFLSIPLTLTAIVGVTNAINLADGLDGLAGGISLLTFAALTWLGFESGRWEVALVAASVCGAIFGFLRFNTHPASIFMGDAGSQLLGFLAIVLSLEMSQQAPYSPFFPLMLLAFPVFDTLRVMVERVRRGLPPFSADRNHFHHKLLARGLYHSEAVALIYVLHALLTVGACLFRFGPEGGLLAGCAGFSGMAMLLLKSPVHEAKSDSPLHRLAKPLLSTWAGIRGSDLPIRWAFTGLKLLLALIGLRLVLLLPVGTPSWFPWFLAGTGGMLLAGLAMPEDWRGWMLRGAFFLVVPFLVYFGQFNGKDLPVPVFLLHLADGGFLVLGLVATMVIKLTRRSGYRSTPLDLLILLIVLAAPLFAGTIQERMRLLIVAAEILVLFFSFEVLLVELRHRFRKLQLVSALFLLAGAGGLLQTVF